ncbi:MBL fold metallo-hydrolase, partial [Vibrio parahaemolyticus]
CKFPARAWLINDENQRWLFDTGYATHFYDHTRHGIMRLYRAITPVYFDSKQALVNQLADDGIKPADINAVI